MKRNSLTTLGFVLLCLASLVLTISIGAAQTEQPRFQLPGTARPQEVIQPEASQQRFSTACAIQPEGTGSTTPSRSEWAQLKAKAASEAYLERFRRSQQTAASTNSANGFGKSISDLQPREEIALIDPTNYGDRFLRDLNGNPAFLEPVIVLHETVGSARSAINYFQTPHFRDADQVSYHTLIKRDGTIVYLVPPDKRAFGAGNSTFIGANGPEAVKTNRAFPASVNNFAYHVSLETPSDGNNNARSHSGYTEAQYQSLAWLVSKTGVSNDRITTHATVDRAGERMDPRSFNFSSFMALLNTYPKTNEVVIRCTPPAGVELLR